jgi:hypothetical protein
LEKNSGRGSTDRGAALPRLEQNRDPVVPSRAGTRDPDVSRPSAHFRCRSRARAVAHPFPLRARSQSPPIPPGPHPSRMDARDYSWGPSSAPTFASLDASTAVLTAVGETGAARMGSRRPKVCF